jgi:hypothetical protein
MRVIIAGGRNITSMEHVLMAIQKSGFKITTLVCGMAPGVDSLGLKWAENHNRVFPAAPVQIDKKPARWGDWDHPDAVVGTRLDGSKYDVLAGHRRNEEMAQNADALILVWDGKSTGSADMKKRALAHKLKVYEYLVK